MIERRFFVGGAFGAAALAAGKPRAAAPAAPAPGVGRPPQPLVWPVAVKRPAGIRSFDGHTDTVPDIIGRIGAPPSLVIFTEGNHLMVLLGDDVLGPFPTWAQSQPHFADLDLGNIVVVTLPQPVVVQMIQAGGIALGNLVLEVSRRSGFYPDIVMGGPAPLRQLRKLGAIEPQARYFAKNRGLALLVRKGNPFGIHGLADVARTGARIALPDAVDEAGSRARYRAAVGELIGSAAADALFAAEAPPFPGRLGIVHRDFPEMVARGYADVALTQYHLVAYWTRIFPNHFELLPVAGAERIFLKIAFARIVGPLRPRAAAGFEEFFFGRAREVYPRYDFASMAEDEFGALLKLD
jgi:hypothetical protein